MYTIIFRLQFRLKSYRDKFAFSFLPLFPLLKYALALRGFHGDWCRISIFLYIVMLLWHNKSMQRLRVNGYFNHLGFLGMLKFGNGGKETFNIKNSNRSDETFNTKVGNGGKETFNIKFGNGGKETINI